MMLFSLLVLISLCLDGVAVYFFRNDYFSVSELLLFHAVALLFILLTYFSIKNYFKESSKKILLLFFIITLFLPFFGEIACFLFFRWMITAQKMFNLPVIHGYALTKQIESIENRYGVGGLRLNLKSTNLPLPKRTDALLAMGKINPDKISNLIRTMLPDKQDEIRLLAFNLLKREQKKIFPKINQAIELLKNEHDDKNKAKLYKWLSNEYWEVIYRNLMEKELVPYSLQQTLDYTKKALQYDPSDAALYVTLGRIALRQNKADAAIDYFKQAISNGMPEERVLLYIAEAYFKQHKYHMIKNLFSHLEPSANVLMSKRLLMFWSKQS